MKEVLWRVRRRLVGSGIMRDVEGAGHPRRALMLYSVHPFRFPDRAMHTHQNAWQSRELARALSERGYAVDVVDYHERRRGLLREGYDLVVDLHPRADPLYQGRLRPGARRIAYLTGSNPAVTNAAERERMRELQVRRGIAMRPRRQTPPLPPDVLERFDAVLLMGGASTRETYAAFRLPPCFPVVNNGLDGIEPTDPSRRDPGHFLYLGSWGQVHKGLDLLLELFGGEPELHLWVCGGFAHERDFVRAYRRELFGTPNIHRVGFADLRSQGFRELQSRCGTMILPSCAEGQCGTVTIALSFGMPCAVSRACGFDDEELLTLPDCRPETLRAVVRELARQSPAQLGTRACAALALMRRKYTPAHYARGVREALRTIL